VARCARALVRVCVRVPDPIGEGKEEEEKKDGDAVPTPGSAANPRVIE
jgi:hypothetical protein